MSKDSQVEELLKSMERKLMPFEKVYKVLMYACACIDSNRLQEGIYESSIPHLYPIEHTIEKSIENVEALRDKIPDSFIEDFIKNISQCEFRVVNVCLNTTNT
jgi:hypothetical protein